MAVLPQTPDLADDPNPDAAAELAALRRRAYGPDADIADDDAARARLEELEGRNRLMPSTPPEMEHPEAKRPAADGSTWRAEAVTDEGSAPETADPAAADTVEVGASAPEAKPAPPVSRSARPRRALRQRRTWMIGGIGAAVGAVVTAGLLLYPWNGPDQVLRIDPDASINLSDYQGWLPGFGAELDSVRVFEPVRGFVPWIVDLEDGGRCLILSQSDSSGILNLACAGVGTDPTMDVLPTMWGTESGAPGQTIRLVARADTVDVWFGGPQPTLDSAEQTLVS